MPNTIKHAWCCCCCGCNIHSGGKKKNTSSFKQSQIFSGKIVTFCVFSKVCGRIRQTITCWKTCLFIAHKKKNNKKTISNSCTSSRNYICVLSDSELLCNFSPFRHHAWLKLSLLISAVWIELMDQITVYWAVNGYRKQPSVQDWQLLQVIPACRHQAATAHN